MPAPYLALGLTGPQLGTLAGSTDLRRRWDALPLAFTVLGIDRVDGGAASPSTLDGSAVAAQLAATTAGARFLVAATVQRDHPYNLARRVASLGHLSRGRSGLVLAVRDVYAPVAGDASGTRDAAGIVASAPPNAVTVHDAARVVRALEQSWPYDSVVADRESGILVRSDRIHHVDHDATFSVAGPLTVPAPPTGPSVIAAWSRGGPAFDLEIGEDGTVAAPGASPDGVLLRASDDLAATLTEVERLFPDAHRALAPGRPLRDALGLAHPTASGGRSAFPAPRPLRGAS